MCVLQDWTDLFNDAHQSHLESILGDHWLYCVRWITISALEYFKVKCSIWKQSYPHLAIKNTASVKLY